MAGLGGTIDGVRRWSRGGKDVLFLFHNSFLSFSQHTLTQWLALAVSLILLPAMAFHFRVLPTPRLMENRVLTDRLRLRRLRRNSSERHERWCGGA